MAKRVSSWLSATMNSILWSFVVAYSLFYDARLLRFGDMSNTNYWL